MIPTLALINEMFGLPERASEHAEMVDHMLEFVHWFMAILFIGWSAFLCLVFWKFRRKNNPKADYTGVQGNASSHIEIGVIIVEAILLLGFALPLWNQRVEKYPAEADVLKVRAVGQKFAWTFVYPGKDGVLGRVDPHLVTFENPLGQDFADPHTADDFQVVGELRIPVDRHVIIDVASKDVIHNLALTPMRIAQDAIPGVGAQMWFKPVKTGEWEIICGQLCGSGHANMIAYLYVDGESDFEAFCEENAPPTKVALASAAQ